jgi:hypothetical protein
MLEVWAAVEQSLSGVWGYMERSREQWPLRRIRMVLARGARNEKKTGVEIFKLKLTAGLELPHLPNPANTLQHLDDPACPPF